MRRYPRCIRTLAGLLAVLALCACATVRAAAVAVVAAESTYGVIARAVGGTHVRVYSIIGAPNVDPHRFEATPAVARAVAAARIVILNGLGYDAWMQRLAAAAPVPDRTVIVVADLDRGAILANRNPHVFYDPAFARALARRLATRLRALDPHHAGDYTHNLRVFEAALDRVDAAIDALHARHPRLSVAATEPVLGYLLHRLGWRDVDPAVEDAVMNGTEPAPAAVARLETRLREHRVSLLVFNRQVGDPLTRHLRAVARRAGVPAFGAREFPPPHTGYVEWLLATVRGLDRALAGDAR